jgi:hypothetical protein
MRFKNKLALALLVLVCSGARSIHAQCIAEVVVTGYQNWPDYIIVLWANLYPLTPSQGSGPGGAYSAKPTAHTNCTTGALSSSQEKGNTSTPSQPNNTSLAIPMRYANPIDIANGSSIGASYGGTNGPAGFMIFPNYAAGANAAMASLGNYAKKGFSIAGLINTWAPPSVNPNAMANTLSGLGITPAMASATALSSLTSNQQLQILAAFAWQEGFKPSGC